MCFDSQLKQIYIQQFSCHVISINIASNLNICSTKFHKDTKFDMLSGYNMHISYNYLLPAIEANRELALRNAKLKCTSVNSLLYTMKGFKCQ